MTLETKAAFARRLNWNRSTVTRAAQSGRLVMVGNQVDVESSLARLQATQGARTDVAARHAAERAAPNPTPAPTPKNGTAPQIAHAEPNQNNVGNRALEPDEPGPPTDGHSRARYKAIALQYENQQIKLGMAIARGLRFPRKNVAREATALGAILRSGLERVIDQTAPRLAVTTDPARRHALLDAELRLITRAVTAEFPRALRRLRAAQQRGEA